MSRVFERSDRLKEKVFDVKLSIDEWRVLFAVNGAMDSGAIANFLDMDESHINTKLQKLLDMEFITVFDTNSKAEEDIALAEELPQAPEELLREEDFDITEEPEIKGASEEIDLEEVISESMEEEAASLETAAAEDDLDELIGNLLEEEPTEISPTDRATGEIDFSEEPSAEKPAGEEGFDLETLFQEEVAETKVSVEELAEAFEESPEPETVEAPPAKKVVTEKAAQGIILVVDDSVVIRKMVEIALENENYDIVSVATGKEALNYLDETTPDLIILDIMLSDMNGLDVLKAIKASKQIPVVMLSAKDTPRETTKAKQLGADDFIPKPFKDEELVGKIKELIRQ